MPVNEARPSAPSMMSIGIGDASGALQLGLDARHELIGEGGHLEAAGGDEVGRDRAVAAAVGDHRDTAPVCARRAHERLAGVDELARRVDPDDARLAAGSGDHRVARDQRAGVGGRATSPGGRAAAVEQDHGLLRVGRACGLDERAPVGHVLGVDGDRARRLVPGEVLDQLGQPYVGLVADRGEAREPEAAALEQHAELEREIAGLRDQPDRAARIVVRGHVELGQRVEHPDAVRAEHDRARIAHALDQRPLAQRGPPRPSRPGRR